MFLKRNGYSELCNYNVMLLLWFMGLWLWLQFSFDAFYCWISWTRGRCMRLFVMRFIVMHEWTICFIWHHHAQINFSECLLPRERCCTLVHWHTVLNMQYYECKRLTSVSLELLVANHGLLFAVLYTHCINCIHSLDLNTSKLVVFVVH